MTFKLRHSKYRHIYSDNPKPEHCWTGFRLCTSTGEQQYIKASAKYFSIALSGGGGPVAVCRLDRPGRFERGKSQILSGHTGSVLDTEWNPFDDSILATASEDTTIKLWGIPEDWEPTDEKGNSKSGEDLKESLIDIEGHRKRVTLLRFNPTVNNLLASASADLSVKVWDVEKAEEVNSFNEMGDLTQDIVWDFRGENFATSCKDKTIRFMDGRTGTVTSSIVQAHESFKTVKCTYLGESGKFMTVGSTQQASREVKVWDLANTSKPVKVEKIDNAAGAFIPLFDSDTNVLYLCGKGDGNIRPFEFETDSLFRLSDYVSTLPTKGMCVVPKRGNNIMACETARLLKLTNASGVQPLSFTVPRKSDAFQDDIFPDCSAAEAAHSVDEWLEGSSKVPLTMSLDPRKTNGTKSNTKKAFKARTARQLAEELKEANSRIKFLEEKLKENDISFD